MRILNISIPRLMQNSRTSRCEAAASSLDFSDANRDTKIPVRSIPWPVKGLRRVSVNSFGFGGSNSHAVLDDAFNFLRLRGLKANHSTTTEPPSPPNLHYPDSKGDDQLADQSHISSPTGGTPPEKQNGALERVKLTIRHAINGNGHRFDQGQVPQAKLLTWSAADEGGMLRVIENYHDHLSRSIGKIFESKSYLNDLAHTLESRRSQLPWRSFAVVESLDALSNLKACVSKACRSSEDVAVAFVFTGQGAQYKEMGKGLLCYPIFENTLRSVDDIFRSFGCQWSLFGMFFSGKS